MSFRISVESTGLRDLRGRFQRMAERGAAEVVEEGVRRATQLVYEAAKANAQAMFKTTNRLDNALTMTIDVAGSSTIGRVEAGFPYSLLERGGTRPYAIFPKNKHALQFEGEGGMGLIFASLAIRGPMPPHSFLKKALDDKREEINALFAGQIRAKVVGS